MKLLKKSQAESVMESPLAWGRGLKLKILKAEVV